MPLDIVQIVSDDVNSVDQKLRKAKQLIESKKAIVFFLASWCGHCKVLKDTLFPLLNNLKTSSLEGAIVLIDNEKQHHKLPYGDSIQGFPTIKLMDHKNNNVTDYNGDRSYDSLKNMMVTFFNKKKQKSLTLPVLENNEFPGIENRKPKRNSRKPKRKSRKAKRKSRKATHKSRKGKRITRKTSSKSKKATRKSRKKHITRKASRKSRNASRKSRKYTRKSRKQRKNIIQLGGEGLTQGEIARMIELKVNAKLQNALATAELDTDFTQSARRLLENLNNDLISRSEIIPEEEKLNLKNLVLKVGDIDFLKTYLIRNGLEGNNYNSNKKHKLTHKVSIPRIDMVPKIVKVDRQERRRQMMDRVRAVRNEHKYHD